MPVDPPDDATLRSIAQRYGLGLTDADLTSFRPFVEGLLASWGAVEELYEGGRAGRGTAPSPPTTPSTRGTSPRRSPAPGRARSPGRRWRSRTTPPSRACR